MLSYFISSCDSGLIYISPKYLRKIRSIEYKGWGKPLFSLCFPGTKGSFVFFREVPSSAVATRTAHVALCMQATNRRRVPHIAQENSSD